jgi:hypothetical protein
VIEISSARHVGWHDVAAALAAGGLSCQMVNAYPLRIALDGPRLEAPVRRIAKALEAWLTARGSSFFPQVVDDNLIVLRLPAA